MTLTQSPTAFGSVAELKMRISALEAAGGELARSADAWKRRAHAAEHERDELATRLELAELEEAETRTTVDQSAELRQLKRERDLYEQLLQQYEASLLAALGGHDHGDTVLEAACTAIRAAKKWHVYPKRYVP